MNLSIIIVNFNSRDKLRSCLDSLRIAVLESLKPEIIVVENHSNDDLSSLAEEYPETKLITSPKNLGMGGGNNLGIKAAKGDYILILNPDTLIRPGAIMTLLEHISHNGDVGMIGPKLLYPDNSLQFSCARFPSIFMPFLRRTFLGDLFKETRDRLMMSDFDHNSISSVDWLMGSCLLFKKEIAKRDGTVFRPRFDERYFMYFEDIDLARQFWTNGLKVVYDPEAVVIHDHQRESAKHPWYLAIFVDPLARQHIISWIKYFLKWGFINKKYQQ